jgi:hypothetical protein
MPNLASLADLEKSRKEAFERFRGLQKDLEIAVEDKKPTDSIEFGARRVGHSQV